MILRVHTHFFANFQIISKKVLVKTSKNTASENTLPLLIDLVYSSKTPDMESSRMKSILAAESPGYVTDFLQRVQRSS